MISSVSATGQTCIGQTDTKSTPQVFSALASDFFTAMPQCALALVRCPIFPRRQQREQLLIAHLDQLEHERVPTAGCMPSIVFC
jgi:hypothetical protein